MIDIFVGAEPGSDISGAEIIAQGKGFKTTLKVSAGDYGRAEVVPTAPGEFTDIELSVESANELTTVYAKNISVNANIIILGTNKLRFDAQIHHDHTTTAKAAPVCSLRC